MGTLFSATRPHGHTATRPHGHTATRPHGKFGTKTYQQCTKAICFLLMFFFHSYSVPLLAQNYCLFNTVNNASPTCTGCELKLIPTVKPPVRAGIVDYTWTATGQGVSGETVEFTEALSYDATAQGALPVFQANVPFSATGKWVITLSVVTDDSLARNCISTDSLIIACRINTCPTGDFTSTIASNTVNLNNLTGSASNLSWRFGDEAFGSGTPTQSITTVPNTTGTFQQPVHTFATNGQYRVALVSTLPNGCTSACEKVLNVNPVMTTSFTPSVGISCGELLVTANITEAESGQTYTWTLNQNGVISTQTGANPNFPIRNINTYVGDAAVPEILTSPTVNLSLQIFGTGANTISQAVSVADLGIFVGAPSTTTNISTIIGSVTTPNVLPPTEYATDLTSIRVIYVAGELSLNRSYRFVNGNSSASNSTALTIRMSDNASFFVNQRNLTASVPFILTLNQVTVARACNECPWAGIRNSGRVATLNRARIHGAYRGIWIDNAGANFWIPSLSLNTTNFVQNHIGIQVMDEPFNLIRYTNVRIQGGTFLNATACTSPLPTVVNSRCRYGIQINGQTLDIAAALAGTTTGYNRFLGLAEGIEAIDATVFLDRCKFRNIHKFEYLDGGFGIDFQCRAQPHILSVNGALNDVSLNNSDQDFQYCDDAIYAQADGANSWGSSIDIRRTLSRDNIRWLTIRSGLVQGGPGDFTSMKVSENEISNGFFPGSPQNSYPTTPTTAGQPLSWAINIVDIGALTTDYYITNNDIGMTFEAPFGNLQSNMTMVLLTDLLPQNAQVNNYYLSENLFDVLNGQNIVVGQQLNGADFFNNQFNYLTQSTLLNRFGLRLTGGTGSKVRCNTFNGDNDVVQANNTYSALFLEGTQGSLVTSNLFNGTDIGVRMQGTLSPAADIAFNDFAGNMWVSMLLGTNGLINPQPSRANEWKSTFTFNSGSVGLNSSSISPPNPFITPNNLPACSEQSPATFAGGLLGSGGICVSDITCAGPNGSSSATGGGGTSQSMMSAPNGYVNAGGSLPEGAAWSVIEGAIETNTPVLFANASLLESAVNYHDLEVETVSNSLVSSDSPMAALFEEIKQLEGTISTIRSLAYADEELTMSEEESIQATLNNLKELSDQAVTALAVVSDEKTATAAMIGIDIQAAQNVSQESAVLSALSLGYLNEYWHGDPIAVYDDLATISMIANLCPLVYGKSVYTMRSLYTALTGKFITSETCVSTQGLVKQATDENIVSEMQWSVFPNPTAGNIWIANDANIDTYNIQLYSVTGQLFLSKTISANDALDMSSLPNGTYLLKAISEKGTYQQKLSVAH